MRIAIIGAGMTGLTLAREISDFADVDIYEKSRGVGGRMATRYAGLYEFDHGAPYFTAKDHRFKAAVEKSVGAGHVCEWLARTLIVDSGEKRAAPNITRYVGTPRMNSWPKALATDLHIQTGRRVVELVREEMSWTLCFENGRPASGYDLVVSTLPAPQACEVLPPVFSGMTLIKNTDMDTCFTLMMGFDREIDFDWDILHAIDGPVRVMIANNRKPDRERNKATLVAHSEPGWSNIHAHANREWVQNVMEEAILKLTDIDVKNAPHRVLHRWLYSTVPLPAGAPFLHDKSLNLIACGDWCLDASVAGAYVSALAVAGALKQQ
jgi:predicted NAD/FAD-dependent oxidoreductase